jgi:hypothetical protein
MNRKIKIGFLFLVLTQGIHSLEEYNGRLWEVFPPATFLSNTVSENPEKGFLFINIGLFIFGFSYWLFLMTKQYLVYRSILWIWIVIEIINGIGHPVWALIERSYTPGVITAPILFVIAVYLTKLLLGSHEEKQFSE